jgi:hypothetical protein
MTGPEWSWVVLVKTAFAKATPAGGEKESDSFDRGHTRNGGVALWLYVYIFVDFG